jgi:mannose-1-phosphate guanylyltransferase
MRRHAGEDNVWSVILAGGESEKARPFIEQWLGRPRPNQYCAFVGRRSPFQHTVDRAALLTPPERRVIVASEAHRAELMDQLRGRSAGPMILQPADRGTAAALFLAVAHIRAVDPHATVLVYPSDHFYCPDHRFLSAAWQAIWAAERLPTKAVLVGASAESGDAHCGWVFPGKPLLDGGAGSVLSVSAVPGRPSRSGAEGPLPDGALANTLFVAAKAGTLWRLGWRFYPLTMLLFEWIGENLGTENEQEAVQTSYKVMERVDSFGELLRCTPTNRLAVVPLEGGRWSDWGDPASILRSIRQMGKEPAFPPELVEPHPPTAGGRRREPAPGASIGLPPPPGI